MTHTPSMIMGADTSGAAPTKQYGTTAQAALALLFLVPWLLLAILALRQLFDITTV